MMRWGDGLEVLKHKLGRLQSCLLNLRAFLKGLSAAWDHGFRRIIVECDNLRAVNRSQSPVSATC